MQTAHILEVSVAVSLFTVRQSSLSNRDWWAVNQDVMCLVLPLHKLKDKECSRLRLFNELWDAFPTVQWNIQVQSNNEMFALYWKYLRGYFFFLVVFFKQLSLHPVKDTLYFHLCNPDHHIGLMHICLSGDIPLWLSVHGALTWVRLPWVQGDKHSDTRGEVGDGMSSGRQLWTGEPSLSFWLLQSKTYTETWNQTCTHVTSLSYIIPYGRLLEKSLY